MPITIDGDSGVSGVNGSATTPALQGTDSNTGIVFGTDTVQIATGGSTRATVDSSGNLGIGTSSPLTRGHLEGTSGDDSTFFLTASNLAANAGGIVSFGGNYDGTNRTAWAQVKGLKENATSGQYGGYLSFSTRPNGGSNTERMRIDNNGFQASTSADNGIEMGISAGSSALKTIFRGRHSATVGSFATGTVSFNVYANGDTENINNSYTAISDITLKENIVPASSQWDNIKGIEVVNYNFKEETGHQTHKQLGVIAQQVEEVSPGLVKDGEEGLKTVNYSVLYMKAVKALQEAQTRIETLETQHADLLARVTALEAA